MTPDDVISEAVYGPYGYIDDIYLSSYVLKMVAEFHGYEFLENVSATENLPEIISECESKALEILSDDEIKKIISYIGLK